jgi:hypothetical protein
MAESGVKPAGGPRNVSSRGRCKRPQGLLTPTSWIGAFPPASAGGRSTVRLCTRADHSQDCHVAAGSGPSWTGNFLYFEANTSALSSRRTEEDDGLALTRVVDEVFIEL